MRTATRTLNLYMARQFLVNVFLTSLVLVGILILAETIGQLERTGSRTDISLTQIVQLVLFKSPDLLLQLVPFTIMIGTLVCFARLSRNHELVAMRASGVSVWQFLLAPGLVCLVIGLFNLGALNPIAASMLKKYENLHSQIYPNNARGLLAEGGEIWLRQPEAGGTVLMRAGVARDQGRNLDDATLYHFDGAGQFLFMTTATSMALDDGFWRMYNVQRLMPDGRNEIFARIDLPTTLTASNIESSFSSANTLSVWDLPDFIRVLQASGFSTAQHEMQLHRALVSPFLGLAMFILAAPFALRMSRMGGVGRLMVIGLMLGFAFYLMSNIIAAYGISGRLPVMLAAWMPGLIACMVGISMLLHFGEE